MCHHRLMSSAEMTFAVTFSICAAGRAIVFALARGLVSLPLDFTMEDGGDGAESDDSSRGSCGDDEEESVVIDTSSGRARGRRAFVTSVVPRTLRAAALELKNHWKSKKNLFGNTLTTVAEQVWGGDCGGASTRQQRSYCLCLALVQLLCSSSHPKRQAAVRILLFPYLPRCCFLCMILTAMRTRRRQLFVQC